MKDSFKKDYKVIEAWAKKDSYHPSQTFLTRLKNNPRLKNLDEDILIKFAKELRYPNHSVFSIYDLNEYYYKLNKKLGSTKQIK